MNDITFTHYPSAADAAIEFPSTGTIWKRLASMAESWKNRSRSRLYLAHADSRMLRDIGISETDRFIAINRDY